MSWRAAFLIGVVCTLGPASAGALFDAAEQGDVHLVKQLLDSGSSPDEPGRNAETPLIEVALTGELPIAELLIEANADVMARNRSGFTALHAAAYSGHPEMVTLLLNHGAALEDRDNLAGQTPLFLAAEEDRVDVVELLLARGADPTVLDRTGFSMLTQTWAKKRFEIVKLLKLHGAVCQSAEVLGSDDFHRRCVEAGQ